MLRIPQVRWLAASLRRPVLKMLLAVSLVGTAALLNVRATWAGVAPVASASAPSTCEGWRLAALARERRAAAVSYASEYGISVDLATRIQRAARAEHVRPRLAFQLIRAESAFRRTAVSARGAIGYTQVMPQTARWLVPGTGRADLFRADTNLRLGFRYLHYLLGRYGGDVSLALTAYNRGPATVDRLVAQGVSPENGYAAKVLSLRQSS